MKPARILNWGQHFENYKSRDRDKCSFVCLPNKGGGLGLTRILSEPDGAAIFGIFVLLVEYCSRHPRVRDGYCTDTGSPDGIPVVPADFAMMWRRPIEEIERAFVVLSSPAVGWVEIPAEYPCGTHAVPAEYPTSTHAVPDQYRGKEGKEGKERTPPLPPQAPPPDSDFHPALGRANVPRERWGGILEEVRTALARNAPLDPLRYGEGIIARRGREIAEAKVVEDKILAGADRPKGRTPDELAEDERKWAEAKKASKKPPAPRAPNLIAPTKRKPMFEKQAEAETKAEQTEETTA